jgi:RIO-like serine/threonine protein kinase
MRNVILGLSLAERPITPCHADDETLTHTDDGFRLTYGGLDYLALRTFSRRSPPSVFSVGKQIGVGKESDIYVVADEHQEQRVMKMQR